MGFSDSTNAGWIANNAIPTYPIPEEDYDGKFPLYAISGDLVVAAVPEPSTMISLAGIAVSGMAWTLLRRRCKP